MKKYILTAFIIVILITLASCGVSLQNPTTEQFKSAFSDARNAVSNFVADNTTGENGGPVFGEDGIAWLKVEKDGTSYYFVYRNNGLQEADYNQATVTNKDEYDAYVTDVTIEYDLKNIPEYVTIKP